MINWILIVILIAVIFLLVKFREVKHRTFMIVVVLMLIFIVITASQLVRQNGINLSKFDDVVLLSRLYFGWLKHVFANLVNLTGNAVKQDWSLNMTGG